MKKLLVIFCAALCFSACKKTAPLSQQTSAPVKDYTGIRNLEEFDKVMSAFSAANHRTINPSAPAITLSKEAIAEMRASIQFNNGVCRGFTKCTLLKKELSIADQVRVYEQLSNRSVRLLDQNENVIATSAPDPTALKKEIIIINDHRPIGSNDCTSYHDADCWTYW